MRPTLALVSLALLSCGAPELAAPRAPAGEGAAAPGSPVSSGSAPSSEGQRASLDASASPGAWQPSITPYTPAPPLPPGACERCRLRRVAYSTEHGLDEALLCVHEPSTPIKPLTARGAVMRGMVSPCDPSCCDRGPCKDAEGSRSK